MKTINIGLLGLGTVGQGVVNLLNFSKENSTLLNQIQTELKVNIRCALVRNLDSKRNCDLTGIKLTTNWREVVENPDIDIIIEVLGGVQVPLEMTKKALELNKPVISANKALLCEKGHILFPLAQKSKGYILFEAACAGAIPIVKNLRQSFISENIHRLVGILNGTSNFILSNMTQSKEEFSKILKKAQQLGYAEADPTFDVEGIDAAHKLSLLSKLAFSQSCNEIYYEGISEIQIDDIEYAKSLNYTIKHLAIADLNEQNELNLRVHPVLIHNKELISKVSGSMNTIALKTSYSGEHLFYGAGAGGNETATAIFSDLAESIRFLELNKKPYRTDLDFQHPVSIKPLKEIEGLESRFYLRLQVLDIKGILAQISQDLNNQNISIDIIHQDEEKVLNNQKIKDIIIITHKTKQSAINQCMAHFENLDCVIDKPIMIRVYN